MVDEHDLGSCGAIRESSSLSFPMASGNAPQGATGTGAGVGGRSAGAGQCFPRQSGDGASGSGSAVEHLLAKERVAGSNPVFRSIRISTLTMLSRVGPLAWGWAT